MSQQLLLQIWVLQCSQSSRHVDSGAQVMSCSAICVMCLCSDFADGMWWRGGIIICFTQSLAQECGHNHEVGDGKKTGKFLRYAFRAFVFCLHFTLDKHTGWDGLDIASDPFRFKFCWWKGSRIQQNEQQIQWIYHCFVGIYPNCWQETFEKTPPFFWFRDGWFSTREADPNVVVDLPEELEISSLGNLASSSRRFNLQLQAQEAWRQVWGDFPGGKVGGRPKAIGGVRMG